MDFDYEESNDEMNSEAFSYAPGTHSYPETSYLQRLEEEMKGSVAHLKQILRGLGTTPFQRIWDTDIAKIKERENATPTTLIGVYGATGAGKSTLLNAVLDRNVMPTSGMRACTSVVTSVAFQPGPTIRAEISFLSLGEWREELRILLEDLRKEDGSLKRTSDLTTEARLAYQKMEAVYPAITPDQLSRLTVNEILNLDPVVLDKLGSTITLETEDAEEFLNLISPYTTSNAPGSPTDDMDFEDEDEALEPPVADQWPLILEARLDLQYRSRSGSDQTNLGVSDANAARNDIAQRYMMKCNYIWVVSPITRAVDEKVAKELLGKAFRTQISHGSYNAESITFIASKCDDIVPNEIIRGLQLKDDSHLQDIDNQRRDILKRLGTEKAAGQDLDEQISDLLGVQSGQGYKRKRPVPNDSRPAKRLCKATSRREQHRVDTAEPLPASDLLDLMQQKQKVTAHVQQLEHQLQLNSRERKRYCSQKRSQAAVLQLQADFRAGIREIEESELESRDDFNPDEEPRDYESIMLPVFTCSSRDYLRAYDLDDGGVDEPEWFLESEETNIPALQDWCHRLTSSSRERAAKDRANLIITLGNSIRSFLQAQIHVTSVDCFNLRTEWETPGSGQHLKGLRHAPWTKTECEDEVIPASRYSLPRFPFKVPSMFNRVKQEVHEPPSIQSSGNLGIHARLLQRFLLLADEWEKDVLDQFEEKLFQSCRQGASKCIEHAEEINDDFAASMRWNTYRATLSRRGTFRKDLNTELIVPLQQHMTHPWTKIFSDQSLINVIEPEALVAIQQVVSLMKKSASRNPALQDRVSLLGEQCLQDAKILINETVTGLANLIDEARREITRQLAAQVRNDLTDGYDSAARERGRGCFVRQKRVLREFLEAHKYMIFTDTAELIPAGITRVVEVMKERLGIDLEVLAERIETTLSAAWEAPQISALQRKQYQNNIKRVSQIIHDLEAARCKEDI